MISVCISSLRTKQSARTLKVCLDCLIDNTSTDYELLVDVHGPEVNPYHSYDRLASQARGDYLLWINDDNYIAPNWDKAFLEVATPDTLVIGGLVESGLYPVVDHCIAHNFGTTPEEFRRLEFEVFCQTAMLPNKFSWSCPWFIPRLKFDGFRNEGREKARENEDVHFVQRWQGPIVRARAWCYHLQKWTYRTSGTDQTIWA